jgi:hypothetical protein
MSLELDVVIACFSLRKVLQANERSVNPLGIFLLCSTISLMNSV